MTYYLFNYNLSEHLVDHVSCYARCHNTAITIFPDLSNHFGEYNIITDRNDSTTSETYCMSQLKSYTLKIFAAISSGTAISFCCILCLKRAVISY